MLSGFLTVFVIEVFKKDYAVSFETPCIEDDRYFDRPAAVPEVDFDLCFCGDFPAVRILHDRTRIPVHEYRLQGVGLPGGKSFIADPVPQFRIFFSECEMVSFRGLCLIVHGFRPDLYFRDLFVIDGSAVDCYTVAVDRDVIGDQLIAFVPRTSELLDIVGVIGQRTLCIVRLHGHIGFSGEPYAVCMAEFCIIDCSVLICLVVLICIRRVGGIGCAGACLPVRVCYEDMGLPGRSGSDEERDVCEPLLIVLAGFYKFQVSPEYLVIELPLIEVHCLSVLPDLERYLYRPFQMAFRCFRLKDGVRAVGQPLFL